MPDRVIAHLRLINQQIMDSSFTRAEDLVGWMGCIQAQDYAAAKWAIGCRVNGIRETEIEQDLNQGKILRTHILRPTWHFVLPGDIRWMLKLTAPKIKALSKIYQQKLGIDNAVLKRSKIIITKALAQNKKMTRNELALLLKNKKINTADSRIGFLLLDAELDGLICGSGREGKQFLYSLLDDLAARTKFPGIEEATAMLANRYFTSRGPATAKDFAWWSGLNLTEARKGIEMNKKFLRRETVDGNTYWFSSEQEFVKSKRNSVYILPAFDEYSVAYRDRKDILNPKFYAGAGFGLKPALVINGQITGTWKPGEKKGKIFIEANLFNVTGRSSAKTINSAYKRYSEFTGKEFFKK
jgi:Winged helix DNA-binding domain